MILTQYGEHMRSDKVISRSKDDMGDVIVVNNSNPVLDTRVCGVIFTDESLHQYSANVISENMYLQVYTKGYQYQLIDDIIDHRNNGHAVCGDYYFITSRSG